MEQDEEDVTCTNRERNMTTSTSMFKSKLVCQVIVMTENNTISNYTSFNDGINSFLRKIDKDLSISKMAIDELQKLILKSVEQTMIVDKIA